MKPKNFAAAMLAAAALFCSSCNWFSRSKKDDPSKALIGKWGFVDIPQKNDTSAKVPGADSSDLLAVIGAAIDSTGIQFNSDSSYSIYKGESVKDTGRFYVDSSGLTLYIKEDSVYKPLKIQNFSDSIIEVFEPEDSVVIRLRRKK